jgi:hypothetical protein
MNPTRFDQQQVTEEVVEFVIVFDCIANVFQLNDVALCVAGTIACQLKDFNTHGLHHACGGKASGCFRDGYLILLVVACRRLPGHLLYLSPYYIAIAGDDTSTLLE